MWDNMLQQVSIFFCSSVSWAINMDPTHINNFLQCLSDKAQPDHPITPATYTPANSSFSYVFQAYVQNQRFVSPENGDAVVIVTALHESHVQATVICCKAHDFLLRTRSGGHDYEGLSYYSESKIPFVLLDMFNLRSIDIDIDSETVWVQSGATLGELYYNIAAKSKTHAFPGGVCPTVGVGGHFSGGGFGMLVRKYGLTVDNVIDLRVVDVYGRILDRESMDEDLFWAINGGGGASFGVVLSWKVKLVRVPEMVTVFEVQRPATPALVYKWQRISSLFRKEIFVRLELRAINNTMRATFIGMLLGKTKDLFPLYAQSFPELGMKREDFIEMRWIESTLFWDGQPRGTPIETLLNRTHSNTIFKIKSDYVKVPISPKGLLVIYEHMIELGGKVYMQWNPYGGRMSEIPSTQTPLPRRAGYMFNIQYLVYWEEIGADADAYYVNLARQLHNTMTPFVSSSPREAYLNYRDVDIGSSPYCNATYEEAEVYGLKYYKENFNRLVKIKTEVDPDNFFKNEQSIPTRSS